MTKPNPFLWPQKVRLAFYDGRGKNLWRSTNRRLDLADETMLWWKKSTRTIYFGVSTTAAAWTYWDENNISTIEGKIRYDLGFDGYNVSIKRVTEGRRPKCASEFRWKLVVRPR